MSAAGIYAQRWRFGEKTDIIIVGPGIPALHHSDGVPVYQVIEHERGFPVRFADGRTANLLAYPSTWPAPGGFRGVVIYAKHERLQWKGPIPVFDIDVDV